MVAVLGSMNMSNSDLTMASRKKLLVIFALLVTTPAISQFRLPSFEIAIKPGYMMIHEDKNVDGHSYNHIYENLSIQGEVSLHIGQRLAVGWFYNRNFFSNYRTETYDGGPIAADREGKHLMYGANVRLSGGRSARLRPYLQLKYFWLETVITYPGYRVASDLNGCTAGVGLMLRASNKLYINLIEAELNMFLNNNQMLFKQTDVFPVLRAGLTYNFSKRK
jgi:hypothetical protein